MFTTMSTQVPTNRSAESIRVQPMRAQPLRPEAGVRRKSRRVAPNLDLRRRDALGRERVASIIEHARWLPKADLALVNWACRSGRPLSELAAMGEAPAWVLSRRLRRIVARATSREFRYVALLLDVHDSPPAWPPTWPPSGFPSGSPQQPARNDLDEGALQLAIARAIFINGLAVREVARVLGVPRKRITRIRDVFALRAEALAT
ncbi:MAG: hypothetical protein KF691_01210 [Phycisphaeraceae bacterium]|nr:hypothetical protein [Phycisphaeraceae bacterium]